MLEYGPIVTLSKLAKIVNSEEAPKSVNEAPGTAAAKRAFASAQKKHTEIVQNDPLPVKLRSWALEQVPLVEAFFVALSLHVVALPVIWVLGAALPWPRGPVVTTVVEFDLENWPRIKSKKITNIREPESSK